jgi:hypothetical protein
VSTATDTDADLAKYVRELVDTFPPSLTPRQRDGISALVDGFRLYDDVLAMPAAS